MVIRWVVFLTLAPIFVMLVVIAGIGIIRSYIEMTKTKIRYRTKPKNIEIDNDIKHKRKSI